MGRWRWRTTQRFVRKVFGGVMFSLAGVCFDHQKGNCSRGEGCRFSHDGQCALVTSCQLAIGEGGGGTGYNSFGRTFGFENPLKARTLGRGGDRGGGGGGGGGVCFDFQRGECSRLKNKRRKKS